MKLSEAILKGCQGTFQHFGGWASSGNRYCALGAAALSIGAKFELGYEDLIPDLGAEALAENFPILLKYTACPYCLDSIGMKLNSMIVHLNDFHKITREAIAEWIASIENPQQENSQQTGARLVEEMVMV